MAPLHRSWALDMTYAPRLLLALYMTGVEASCFCRSILEHARRPRCSRDTLRRTAGIEGNGTPLGGRNDDQCGTSF